MCALVVGLAIINQVFSLIEPIIYQRIIDNYALKYDVISRSVFLKGTIGLLLLFIGTAFISRVAKNFQDYYLNRVSQRSGADMYSEGVEHSLDLPYAVFEDERSGETLGKLQKARTDTEKLIQDTINVFFLSGITLIFVISYAATVYWVVPVIYGAMVLIIGTITLVFSKKIKTVQTLIVAETTALAGSTTESLRNIELVKSLGLTGQEVGRLNATTEKILKLELKKLKYVRTLDFIQGTVTNFIRALIYLCLFYLIYTQKITLGQYFSLNIYSYYLFFPLTMFAGFIATYRTAEASLANYEILMNTKPEPRAANPKEVGEVTELAFKNVSFGYKSATTQALSDISYTVKQGETIAFVGPSGSGKTSLVKAVAAGSMRVL